MMTDSHTDGEARLEEVHNCYVIQTFTGEEQEVLTFMKVIAGDYYLDAFTPKRVMKRRRRGEWVNVKSVIFPGYVFVITDKPDALFLKLKRVPRLSKLLCDGVYNFYHLTSREAEFILKIGMDRKDHTFGLSLVSINKDASFKTGDRVRVISGDLKGFEGDIVYYDIHHRKAMVKTSLFGGTVIHVGVDLMVKEGGRKIIINVKE